MISPIRSSARFLATVLLFSFFGHALAGRDFDSGEALIKRSAAADQLEIRAIPPKLRGPILVTKSKDRIAEILSWFQFSEKPLRGEKEIVDGEEIWLVPLCQCLGDYELVFRLKDEELAKFAVHHAQFVRTGGRNQEFDLMPQSGKAVMDRLDLMKDLAIAKEREEENGQGKTRK